MSDRYTVRTAREWARAHLTARTAPYHGLPQHGPATYTAWSARVSRLLRGYPWTLAGADAIDPVHGCPFCSAPYVSHLGADTPAGRYCHACGQYAGFPDANAEPRTADESRGLLACENCGEPGHDTESCTRYLECLRCKLALPALHNDPCESCPDCGAAFVMRDASAPLAGECPRCGQQSPGVFERCARCVAADRASQGTQDRLFTPTAAPIPGQQTL